jgi:hypothetical protein
MLSLPSATLVSESRKSEIGTLLRKAGRSQADSNPGLKLQTFCKYNKESRTRMAYYLEVIELTNRGTAAAQSDPETALSMYHAALLKTRDLAESIPSSTPSLELEQHHEANNAVGHFLGDVSLWVSDAPIVECSFLHAIPLMRSYAVAFHQDPLVTLSTTFCILEFNLGVLYHGQGIIHQEEDRTTAVSLLWLVRAQVCYHKALALLLKITVSCAAIDFLVLCIQNNLSQICCARSEYEQARLHFESLTTHAAVMDTYFYDSTETTAVLGWLKQVFLIHGHALPFPKAAAAA